MCIDTLPDRETPLRSLGQCLGLPRRHLYPSVSLACFSLSPHTLSMPARPVSLYSEKPLPLPPGIRPLDNKVLRQNAAKRRLFRVDVLLPDGTVEHFHPRFLADQLVRSQEDRDYFRESSGGSDENPTPLVQASTQQDIFSVHQAKRGGRRASSLRPSSVRNTPTVPESATLPRFRSNTSRGPASRVSTRQLETPPGSAVSSVHTPTGPQSRPMLVTGNPKRELWLVSDHMVSAGSVVLLPLQKDRAVHFPKYGRAAFNNLSILTKQFLPSRTPPQPDVWVRLRSSFALLLRRIKSRWRQWRVKRKQALLRSSLHALVRRLLLAPKKWSLLRIPRVRQHRYQPMSLPQAELPVVSQMRALFALELRKQRDSRGSSGTTALVAGSVARSVSTTVHNQPVRSGQVSAVPKLPAMSPVLPPPKHRDLASGGSSTPEETTDSLDMYEKTAHLHRLWRQYLGNTVAGRIRLRQELERAWQEDHGDGRVPLLALQVLAQFQEEVYTSMLALNAVTLDFRAGGELLLDSDSADDDSTMASDGMGLLELEYSNLPQLELFSKPPSEVWSDWNSTNPHTLDPWSPSREPSMVRKHSTQSRMLVLRTESAFRLTVKQEAWTTPVRYEVPRGVSAKQELVKQEIPARFETFAAKPLALLEDTLIPPPELLFRLPQGPRLLKRLHGLALDLGAQEEAMVKQETSPQQHYLPVKKEVMELPFTIKQDQSELSFPLKREFSWYSRLSVRQGDKLPRVLPKTPQRSLFSPVGSSIKREDLDRVKREDLDRVRLEPPLRSAPERLPGVKLEQLPQWANTADPLVHIKAESVPMLPHTSSDLLMPSYLNKSPLPMRRLLKVSDLHLFLVPM